MIPKPKEVLFKNIYVLSDGSKGTLFKSQKELGQLIMPYLVDEYKNLQSLLSFFSQILKTNIEKGAKPIPYRLKSLIINASKSRLGKKDMVTFEKDFDKSIEFWKVLIEVNTHKKQNNLDELIRAFMFSEEVVIFLPYAQYPGKFGSVAMEYYALLLTKILEGLKFTVYLPSTFEAALFWSYLIKTEYDPSFNLPSQENLQKELSKRNKAGQLTTKVIPSEYCLLPHYFFLESVTQLLDDDGPSEIFVSYFLSMSFFGTEEIQTITYSQDDSKRFWSKRIAPIYYNRNKFIAIKDITYEELIGPSN